MDSINVKNGITLKRLDNYQIFAMYTNDAKEYYMCLPTHEANEYQMIIDFPEEYYKALLSDDIINEIENICNTLYGLNDNYIYLLPDITTYDLNVAKEENDNHAYQNLLRELQKYTFSTYQALSANENIKINQVICMITQTDDDKKLMNWLDINMPNYFTSLDLSALIKNEEINDDTGWTTLSGPTAGLDTNEHTNNKPKVKILVPNKHGFLNITFIMVIILLSIVIGVGLAILLIK